MTISEEIAELEERLFMIDMIDRWTDEDREAYRLLNAKLSMLKKRYEHIKERARKYYHEHKKELCKANSVLAMRKYHNNPAYRLHRSELMHNYYLRHKDEIHAQQKQYRENNKEALKQRRLEKTIKED